MPRFVVLEHDHPHLHWDLMLQCGGASRTWRLAEPPTAGRAVAAEALADHRLHYLDYEGPVGSGRGTVVRWDSGTYTLAESAGELRLELRGRRLDGPATLRCREGRWTFARPPETFSS